MSLPAFNHVDIPCAPLLSTLDGAPVETSRHTSDRGIWASAGAANLLLHHPAEILLECVRSICPILSITITITIDWEHVCDGNARCARRLSFSGSPAATGRGANGWRLITTGSIS